MEDLFTLQDEITKKIIVSLQVELTLGDDALIDAKGTDNIEAWSKVAKGFNYWIKFTKEDNKRAQKLFEDAVKLDPTYATAWVNIGWTYHNEVLFGWSKSSIDSLNSGNEAAQKALAIDDQNPRIHLLQGDLYILQRKYDEAHSKLNTCLSLDPNSSGANFTMGLIMLLSGRFEESLELIQYSMRLSPYYPWFYLYQLGHAYFFLNRYEEAIKTFNQLEDRSRKGECPIWWAPLALSMVYQEMMREEEAKTFMTEALKNYPGLSIEFLKLVHPYKSPDNLQRILNALRKAGLPDQAPKGAVP